mmetsp:Transcript_104765/g.291767  ORF Transcript_104765/g.291767 Transcript_104765/m.291767 type:complete len:248 (+) Transcript_104765:281-1024(+)
MPTCAPDGPKSGEPLSPEQVSRRGSLPVPTQICCSLFSATPSEYSSEQPHPPENSLEQADELLLCTTRLTSRRFRDGPSMVVGSSMLSVLPKPIATWDWLRPAPSIPFRSSATGEIQAGNGFESLSSAMSWPCEHLPSKFGWQIRSASTRKLVPPGKGATLLPPTSWTSPSQSAMCRESEQGRKPPPKQCAAVTPKVGEMIEAPQPSHMSVPGLCVGSAKYEYFSEGRCTTVPLMMRKCCRSTDALR